MSKTYVIIIDNGEEYDLLSFKTKRFRDEYWDSLLLDNSSKHCKATNTQCNHKISVEIVCTRNSGTEICFCKQVKNKQLGDIINVTRRN